ncbi:Flp family type IVb pilin [Vibrio clamense]|uniref:Flp family type IVb pilin n=1 Tax=Vibrio clamense TaxID=2910254 RepID=UPI003D2012D6
MKNALFKIKIFFENEGGLTVVEYVIGAAFLVAGLTVFFSNHESVLSDSLVETINK